MTRKRRWEIDFQKWSNYHSMHDPLTSFGKCGWGAMCDHCQDNSFGNPCVRALNLLCKDWGITIDYENAKFEEVWYLNPLESLTKSLPLKTKESIEEYLKGDDNNGT